MALMEPGVRPSISLATCPTALPLRRTWLVPRRTATTEGSLRTTPSPLTQTSVLQVPRSMPMSTLNMPSSESKITPGSFPLPYLLDWHKSATPTTG